MKQDLHQAKHACVVDLDAWNLRGARCGAHPTPAALTLAAQHGRVAAMRRLLAAGARDNGDAMVAALRIDCRGCVDAIVEAQGWPVVNRALVNLLPPGAGALDGPLRQALAHGADVKIVDPRTEPVLLRAVRAAGISPQLVQELIDRGAAVQDTTATGLTALDLARRAGNGAIEPVLARAGAGASREEVPPAVALARSRSVAEAVGRSLPLLQRTALQFYRASGCVSCHHNSVTQVVAAEARQAGFAIDAPAAREDVATTVRDVQAGLEQAVHGIVIPGGLATTTGYILIGVAAAHHPRDAGTDALVRLLRMRQLPDGRWSSVYRPPIEAGEFTATAVSLRGLQLYGANRPDSADAKAVRAATAWLEDAQPRDTEDRVFRLFGLTWAGADAVARDAARRDLVAMQRADGGWGQLPALPSDAYATGTALAALAEAGMRANDPVYRRGVEYLLSTQLADGSWFVRSRSHPTQAYFESGFPHGADQFISAAATNWATLALIRAQPR